MAAELLRKILHSCVSLKRRQTSSRLDRRHSVADTLAQQRVEHSARTFVEVHNLAPSIHDDLTIDHCCDPNSPP